MDPYGRTRVIWTIENLDEKEDKIESEMFQTWNCDQWKFIVKKYKEDVVKL